MLREFAKISECTAIKSDFQVMNLGDNIVLDATAVLFFMKVVIREAVSVCAKKRSRKPESDSDLL